MHQESERENEMSERSALGYSLHFFLGMVKFSLKNLVKGLKILFDLAAIGATGGDYDRKREAKKKRDERQENQPKGRSINDDDDLRPEWKKRLDREGR